MGGVGCAASGACGCVKCSKMDVMAANDFDMIWLSESDSVPSGPPVSASGAVVTSSAAGDSAALITSMNKFEIGVNWSTSGLSSTNHISPDVGLGLVGGDDGVIGVDRCDDVVVDIDSGSWPSTAGSGDGGFGVNDVVSSGSDATGDERGWASGSDGDGEGGPGASWGFVRDGDGGFTTDSVTGCGWMIKLLRLIFLEKSTTA